MRIQILFIAAMLSMPLAFTACDRKVSETTHTHEDSDGNVSKETKTVTENPNTGDVKVTKEKTESHP